MKVLIIGSGGREHALAWKIAQSPKLGKLYALPGSAGIGQLAECLRGNPLDCPSVVRTCGELGVDLVIVGPEAPLALGLCDALRASGIRAFGPSAAAARLESSKSFAKDFMTRHGIPTARFEVYDDSKAALASAEAWDLPVVIKADGLASGKGVRVCRTRLEAVAAVQDFMVSQTLGQSGARVVIEECLKGQEATALALCDGSAFGLLPMSRDHKRLRDGDSGPNTGGMGAFAPLSELSADVLHTIRETILRPTVDGLREEGLEYRGLLYCGLMLTPQGPKVLEFNVRFGDPETQAVLPLLEGDFLEILEACADGKLGPVEVSTRPGYAVTVTLSSEGYPGTFKIGLPITGIETAQAMSQEGWIFHAGTARPPEGWVTAGGRVLSATAAAATLARARGMAYALAERIRFEGMHYRRDIAAVAGPPVPAMRPETLKR